MNGTLTSLRYCSLTLKMWELSLLAEMYIRLGTKFRN